MSASDRSTAPAPRKGQRQSGQTLAIQEYPIYLNEEAIIGSIAEAGVQPLMEACKKAGTLYELRVVKQEFGLKYFIMYGKLFIHEYKVIPKPATDDDSGDDDSLESA